MLPIKWTTYYSSYAFLLRLSKLHFHFHPNCATAFYPSLLYLLVEILLSGNWKVWVFNGSNERRNISYGVKWNTCSPTFSSKRWPQTLCFPLITAWDAGTKIFVIGEALIFYQMTKLKFSYSRLFLGAFRAIAPGHRHMSLDVQIMRPSFRYTVVPSPSPWWFRKWSLWWQLPLSTLIGRGMGVGQSHFKQKESVRPHSITFFEQKRQLKKGFRGRLI